MPNAAGFSLQNDPLASLGHGYRSAKFRPSDIAVISYNGFEFPSTARCKVDLAMEYDKSGRTIKYVTLALTVEATITPITTGQEVAPTPIFMEGTMDDIRHRLTQAGQRLQFKHQGLGTLDINNPEGVMSDLDYGPKPQVLSWTPIAGGIACDVEWLVTSRVRFNNTAASNCQGLGGIAEFNYDYGVKISDAGVVVRTVNGYLEIAASLVPQNGPTDPIHDVTLWATETQAAFDAAIEKFFPVIPGYKREFDYKLDHAKKALSFSVIDTMVMSDHALPPGCINFTFDEAISSQFAGGSGLSAGGVFSKWTWNMSFSADVGAFFASYAGNSRATGVIRSMSDAKKIAYAAMTEIIRNKLQYFTDFKKKEVNEAVEYSVGTGGSASGTYEISVIPLTYRLKNSQFGPNISCDVSFLVIATSDLIIPITNILKTTGAFSEPSPTGQPYYHGNWQNWADENYLYGRLVNPDSPTPYDYVVDLCHPLVPSGSNQIGQDDSTGSASDEPVDTPRDDRKASDWVAYDNAFSIVTERDTLVSKPLSSSATVTTETYDDERVRFVDGERRLVPAAYESSTNGETVNQAIVESNSAAVRYVTMEGYGVRLGAAVRAPSLVSVAGSAVTLHGPAFEQSKIARVGIFGATDNRQNLYITRWKKTYLVTGTIDRSERVKYVTSGVPSNLVSDKADSIKAQG